jgi:hypothetical protein
MVRRLCTILLIFLAFGTIGLPESVHADSTLLPHITFDQLSLGAFISGYGSDKYGTTHGGFELQQTVTEQLSLVARATAYQVYQGTGFDSPLLPARRSSTRNFGRFQGGVNLTLLPGVSLQVLGGEDLGDSHAPVIEGDFFSWLHQHSLHPINFSFSSTHFYENEVTSSRLDVRAIVLSTSELMLLAGIGGAIWGGGSVGDPKGQAGPDLGIFVRQWHSNIDVQSGYGSSHVYGWLSFTRQFHWDE